MKRRDFALLVGMQFRRIPSLHLHFVPEQGGHHNQPCTRRPAYPDAVRILCTVRDCWRPQQRQRKGAGQQSKEDAAFWVLLSWITLRRRGSRRPCITQMRSSNRLPTKKAPTHSISGVFYTSREPGDRAPVRPTNNELVGYLASIMNICARWGRPSSVNK